MLDRAFALNEQVALRPEPFGALAYHYGTRRLIFLRHPDIVRVVESVHHHPTLRDTLVACDVDETRWPAFESAVASLLGSEMLHERQLVG